MIHIRCACGEVYHAEESHAGRRIRCRCGAVVTVSTAEVVKGEGSQESGGARVTFQDWLRQPAPFARRAVKSSPISRNRTEVLILGIAAVIIALSFALWRLGQAPSSTNSAGQASGPVRSDAPESAAPPPTAGQPVKRKSTTRGQLLLLDFGLGPSGQPTAIQDARGKPNVAEDRPVPIAISPAEAREQEIIQQDAGKPGEPELNQDYEEINERYFGNKLPAAPVMWEPKLEGVGPLIAKGFRLHGLATMNNRKPFIVLNPAVRRDAPELKRTLCHEMVHVYLYSVGDFKTAHGAAFQEVLRRLSVEGAFEGDPASRTDKERLRSWLDRELASLEGERPKLGKLRDEMGGENDDLDRQTDELNLRISTANSHGYGWPSDDEIQSAKRRQDLFKFRLNEFDARIERYNADVRRFNSEVNVYNLMMAYPDGLDEQSAMGTEPSLSR